MGQMSRGRNAMAWCYSKKDLEHEHGLLQQHGRSPTHASTGAQCPVDTDASYGRNAIAYHYKQEKLGDGMGSHNNDQTDIDMVVHGLIK